MQLICRLVLKGKMVQRQNYKVSEERKKKEEKGRKKKERKRKEGRNKVQF